MIAHTQILQIDTIAFYASNSKLHKFIRYPFRLIEEDQYLFMYCHKAGICLLTCDTGDAEDLHFDLTDIYIQVLCIALIYPYCLFMLSIT